MTSIPSFEFCAFAFLTQWLESELELHGAISSAPTENDIRKALAYFQVARTFNGLNTPGKAALILKSLIEVRNDPTLKGVIAADVRNPTLSCVACARTAAALIYLGSALNPPPAF